MPIDSQFLGLRDSAAANPATLSATFASLFPSGVVAAELRAPGDASLLWPEEAASVANAVPKRIQEFAAGRLCARRALAAMGVAPTALGLFTAGEAVGSSGGVRRHEFPGPGGARPAAAMARVARRKHHPHVGSLRRGRGRTHARDGSRRRFRGRRSREGGIVDHDLRARRDGVARYSAARGSSGRRDFDLLGEGGVL